MTERARVRTDVLTVEVEDYFHIEALQRYISSHRWDRFERRLEKSTARVLDLLSRFQIHATFFVRGWIASRSPGLIAAIAGQGHEVAEEGFFRQPVRQMSESQFREDLARAREAVERASGMRVRGYRFPRQWLDPIAPWALRVLSEEGYAYHSSFAPIFVPPWRAQQARVIRPIAFGERTLWQVPLSTANLGGLLLPIAGGNYFRQLPRPLLERLVESWHRKEKAPFVMYFHVRELDPEQPQITSASFVERIRHYRNLDRMLEILEAYFQRYRFTSVADHLGLPGEPALSRPERESSEASVESRSDPEARLPVTIVVPCHNEAPAIPYLANTLRGVEERLGRQYELHYLFVDDGSDDGTFAALECTCALFPRARLVRHAANRGVAAAIMTGIQEASTEVVCSIDCDCTYDPAELEGMIPLLAADVDLVTSSPYHPRGRVANVPSWRLALSRGASFLYRRLSRQKLHTYTSCFRVYRRAAALGLELREGGFLGVAELLMRLDLGGSRIVEHPATLESRVLGYSKMKVARSVAGHLRLMKRLLALRFRAKPSPRPVPASSGEHDSVAVTMKGDAP